MLKNGNNTSDVPKNHPRYLSLKHRHQIIEGMKNLVVAEAGLIAHGRGECFDYILGENTNASAKEAIKTAVAALLLANKPVISVNGNVAALCPKELVKLSKTLKVPIEINLFYQKQGRIEAIKNVLEEAGATNILGSSENEMVELEGLESNRRKVSKFGILNSDWVMIPLEDGDRTEILKKLDKKVIAIDLNPISRTSLWADVTIVDNIVRVLPEMTRRAEELKKLNKDELHEIIFDFDNKKNIQQSLDLIIDFIKRQKEEAFKIFENK
jgi:4-phosphopantoate--beta-alanine ligase